MRILVECFMNTGWRWVRIMALFFFRMVHYFHILSLGLLTRTWFDNCLSSQTVHNSIPEVSVKYECQDSYHLPLVVKMNYGVLPIFVLSEKRADKIKWEFSNQSQVDGFYGLVCTKTRDELEHHCECSVSPYDNACRKTYLSTMWNSFTELVFSSV